MFLKVAHMIINKLHLCIIKIQQLATYLCSYEGNDQIL